jgi:hypothetical protein
MILKFNDLSRSIRTNRNQPVQLIETLGEISQQIRD